jgi:Protein of unknown function (DUF1236)
MVQPSKLVTASILRRPDAGRLSLPHDNRKPLRRSEMNRMTRTNLLATGAIVALAFATGTSVAQQERQERGGAPAPAEKIAPPGTKQAPSHNERLEGRTGEGQNRGRSETTGQAPRENQQDRLQRTPEPRRGGAEQQGPRSERNGQGPPIGQAPREDRRGRTMEDRTTGQAPREDGRNRASEQNRLEQERGRTDREENRSSTTGQGAAGTRANVNITSEQRTRIHETIIHERNAPRVNRVNFDVSVGTRVPRGVRFAALPLTILEIEPSWRGFEYFMIGDEIVVVDPRSMQIVAIVEA